VSPEEAKATRIARKERRKARGAATPPLPERTPGSLPRLRVVARKQARLHGDVVERIRRPMIWVGPPSQKPDSPKLEEVDVVRTWRETWRRFIPDARKARAEGRC